MTRFVFLAALLFFASCQTSTVRAPSSETGARPLSQWEAQKQVREMHERADKEFSRMGGDVEKCLVAVCGPAAHNIAGSDSAQRSQGLETVAFKQAWPALQADIDALLLVMQKIQDEKIKAFNLALKKGNLPLSETARAYMAYRKIERLNSDLLGEAMRDPTVARVVRELMERASDPSKAEQFLPEVIKEIFSSYEGKVRSRVSSPVKEYLLDHKAAYESSLTKTFLQKARKNGSQTVARDDLIQIVRLAGSPALRELGPFITASIPDVGNLNADAPDFTFKFIEKLGDMGLFASIQLQYVLEPAAALEEINKDLPDRRRLSRLFTFSPGDIKSHVGELPEAEEIVKERRADYLADAREECRGQINHMFSVGSSPLWTAKFEEKKALMLDQALRTAQEIAPEADAGSVARILNGLKFQYQKVDNLPQYRARVAQVLDEKRKELAALKAAPGRNEAMSAFLNAAIFYRRGYFSHSPSDAQQQWCAAGVQRRALVDVTMSFTSESEIMISWFSLAYPEVGISILAHEVGHALSQLLRPQEAKLRTLTAIKQCLAKRNPFDVQYMPLTETAISYLEEDWADWFSSKVMKRLQGEVAGAKPLSCALIHDQGSTYGGYQSLAPIYRDNHSGAFLRILLNDLDSGSPKAECRPLLEFPLLKKQDLGCDFGF